MAPLWSPHPSAQGAARQPRHALAEPRKAWNNPHLSGYTMPNRATRITASLSERFAPAEVSVTDDSARTPAIPRAAGGETHYSVRIVSPAFAGQSRVARSRAAHEALAAEFETGLHALSLRLLTPEEAARG
jgi:BolA protein